ncbi:type II secretion system protein [Janthinobacterium sp. CG3]|uniref:type II secretion system protein n=1 Tax=Janthinobacterium sp. CG3 TaxID=1075768 RepID=UPI000345F961|nr:type II secretion system protein [Janthinobacterium sp. CG3]
MSRRPLLCWNNSRRGAQRGIGLFESAVAAIVVGVLGAVLLTRLAYYQEQAELAAVARTANLLRAALALKLAHLYAGNRQAEMPALARQNPMEWLAARPANYAGEYAAPASGEVAAGQWYFDRGAGKLVYLLAEGKIFSGSQPKALQFKVSLSGPAQNLPVQSKGMSIVLNQVYE